MSRLVVAGAVGAAGLTVAAAGYVGVVTGRLTVDLGVGRRIQPLGPLDIDIGAPRERVFEAAAAPYAERRPRAMAGKVQVWERDGGMVVAAHRTPVGGRLTAVTVEAVTLEPPERIGFRVLRGPVPHVIETIRFSEREGGTRVHYEGELGTDLGPVGEAWGRVVARSWVATVRAALDTIKTEAER